MIYRVALGFLLLMGNEYREPQNPGSYPGLVSMGDVAGAGLISPPHLWTSEVGSRSDILQHADRISPALRVRQQLPHGAIERLHRVGFKQFAEESDERGRRPGGAVLGA